MMNRDTSVKSTGVAYAEGKCAIHCLSWSGVIAGTLVAVGLSFLLNLFGLSANLAIYSLGEEGATAFLVGGFFSTLIATMLVLFFAGWIAGYLGRYSGLHPNFGFLYGLVTWSLALVLSMLLASSVGTFMNEQYQSFRMTGNERLANFMAQANRATVSATARATGAESATSSASKPTPADAKAMQELSKPLFLLFILFFVGAVSASFGGHVGMYRRDRRDV